MRKVKLYNWDSPSGVTSGHRQMKLVVIFTDISTYNLHAPTPSCYLPLGMFSPVAHQELGTGHFLISILERKKSSNDRNLSKLIAGKTLFSTPRARGARGPPGLSVSVACPHVVKRAVYSSRAGAARRGAARPMRQIPNISLRNSRLKWIRFTA